MTKRLRIGILFGGRSGEHEVSLLSAASILRALDPAHYEVVPLAITREGQWLSPTASQALLEGSATLTLAASHAPEESHLLQATPSGNHGLDLVFPVLHGTFGEDGTIQGLLELAGLPYVGSGVLGSATGMDKAIMKQLFAAAGLPQTPHVVLLRSQWRAGQDPAIRLIEETLRYPLFVKPANLGSSVGISKVHDRSELEPALDLAARFDRKLVIEQGVGGPGAKPRELEVAILGNDNPEASVVGEIVPGAEFYDYDAKYHSNTSIPLIPAALAPEEERQVRHMALAAFRACDCAGLARVDFLMEPAIPGQQSSIFLNEINTMPGFTSISMFPKLWEASGIAYRKLIDRLVILAIERHQETQQTSFAAEPPRD